MEYFILTAILTISIVLFLRYSSHVRAKKLLKKIQLDWGNPKNESFYFNRIGKYAAVTRENGANQHSKQTLHDIDFEDLFAFVDRTTSKVGQQVLFKKLIQTDNSVEALHFLNSRVELFTSNASLREEVQKELQKLNSGDAYFISTLFQDKLLERPAWFALLYINVFIVVVLMALSFSYPVLLICLIVPIAANMYLHYLNKNNMFQFVKSFPQLSVLISVARRLQANINLKNEAAVESISVLEPFQWKMQVLSLDDVGGVKGELNQIATYFIELVKIFFLIEVYALFHLTRELETKKESILTLFKYVGDLDVAIAVASLRAGTLKTCQPEFVKPNKQLSVKNIYHPLIKNCAGNDLILNGKSALMTGSNMSGKSTFLRTVIINSILAQTIYTCFADEFKSPVVKQFSSIRIDDNLFEGRSYYFEEVNIMSNLIQEVESSDQNLFILDEVFKGTNTIERIASGKAILSYLNRNNNIVIVSTHDIELSRMLESEYDLYHFTDTIEGDQLHFDHRIKAGPLKTRNAIKILEISGYPKDITNEANRLSKELTSINITEELK